MLLMKVGAKLVHHLVYQTKIQRPGRTDRGTRSLKLGSGAPGKIRTPDPLIRSQVLYPAELPAQYKYYKLKIGKKELIIFFFPRGHIP